MLTHLRTQGSNAALATYGLAKEAIFNYATGASILRNRIPRAVGRSHKNNPLPPLKQFVANVQKRYGKRSPQLAKEMEDSVKHVEQIAGPNAINEIRTGNESSMSPAGTLTLNTTNPVIAGHEAGHALDYQSKPLDFFGDRGFFGLGGNTGSMIPSETSATRHAFNAAGKIDPETGLGTATYMQGALAEGGRKGARRALARLDRELGEKAMARRPEIMERAKALGVRNRRLEAAEARIAPEDKVDARTREIVKTMEAERQAKLDAYQVKRDELLKKMRGASNSEYAAVDAEMAAHRKTHPGFYSLSKYSPEVQEKVREQFPGMSAVAQMAKNVEARRTLIEQEAARAFNPVLNPEVLDSLSPRAQKILQAMRNRVGRQLDAEIQPGTGDAVNQYVDQLIAQNRR